MDQPKNPGPSDVLTVATLMRTDLAARGITASIDGADDLETAEVVLPSGEKWFLHNLVPRVREHDRSEWPDVVHEHVDGMLASRDQVPPAQMSADELRARLRSRLVADTDDLVDVSYGRPFAPGIVEVLCIDYPQTVLTLSRSDVDHLALELDEAFAEGRRNTSSEPIEDRFALAEGLWGLTGDSMFAASRAVDLAPIVAAYGGASAHGIAFALINRSLIVYTVITPDAWQDELMRIVGAADTITTDPEFFHPGGVVSPNVFYLAPDGRIDLIGGPVTDDDGVPSLAIALPTSFTDNIDVGGLDSE